MDQETSLDRTFSRHDELLCNLMEGRMVEKPTRCRRRLQVLEDLYQNSSYEVLKTTAKDRNSWRERKCQKPAVQRITEEACFTIVL